MFSLIVATLDRTDELDRLFTSLDAQTYRSFEVLVVDQNRDDRLLALFQRHQGLTIRHLRSGPGLSRGRNIGLPLATADLIAFPDDDCWYPPQLLASVARWFADNPQYSGLFTALRDADGKAVGPRWPQSPCEATRHNLVALGISPNAFLRRAVTDAVGVFDENIGVGAQTPYQSGEDMDYFLRPLNLGYRMMFDPAFEVHHPSFHDPARLSQKAYGYALGGAYVLRAHGYSIPYFLWQVCRSLGGAAVSLLKFDFFNTRIYLLRAAGQLRGYILGPRDLRRFKSYSRDNA